MRFVKFNVVYGALVLYVLLQACGSRDQAGGVISLTSQNISFSKPDNQTVGTSLALSATATSGLPVSFSSETLSICTVSGATASFLVGGTCTIQATQPGNRVYAAASPVAQSFTVNNLAPTISMISPNLVVMGSAAENITLTGTNFLPATLAIYAGAAHAIIYVNSTTITLPLNANDMAGARVNVITLANPSPGGGTASVNLPVLYETTAMLAKSQLAAGDQARLQRLIQKGRDGTPVTIAAIGGSITEGYGASDFSHSYINLVRTWWNRTFPSSPSRLVNAGIGATGSDYGSLRTQRDVLSHNPDLVIVEFAVNDGGDAPANAAYVAHCHEGLLRQLLDAPSQPAVIVLYLMKYQLPVVEATVTAQSWQSAIGANYNLPMVSYFDAISPELTNGNIALADISIDGVHPTDLGHAYAAQFIETNLQIAIDNFPTGSNLEDLPATQAPLYSSDFEFTSLTDGIGADGPALNPTNNIGWVAEPFASNPALGPNVGAGLESSIPGSTLDFTVTGKEILMGFWGSNGPMGQIAVTVDGVTPGIILDGWNASAGFRAMGIVGDGLNRGPHLVHVELLGTADSGSTGNTFRLLCIGGGGVH